MGNPSYQAEDFDEICGDMIDLMRDISESIDSEMITSSELCVEACGDLSSYPYDAKAVERARGLPCLNRVDAACFLVQAAAEQLKLFVDEGELERKKARQ